MTNSDTNSPFIALAPMQRLDEHTRTLGRAEVRNVRAILRSTRTVTGTGDCDSQPASEAA